MKLDNLSVLVLATASLTLGACGEAATCPAGTSSVDDRCLPVDAAMPSDGEATDAEIVASDAGGDACSASSWYADTDGDGHGNADEARESCDAPAGHVASSDDCNDSDATVHSGADELCDGIDNDCDDTVDEEVTSRTYHADSDGDGYGDAESTVDDCAPPSGYVADSSDCNDSEPAVHPGATEVCNGTDDNCDSAVDEGVLTAFYRDDDGDGYGAATATMDGCSAPAGYVADGTDCDDSCMDCHPGGTEACDGLDNDCDGTVDDGNPGGGANCGTDVGACSFGTVTCSGGSLSCSGGTGPTAETCNGADDDCDGTVDDGVLATFYLDTDGDGYGTMGSTTTACSRPAGYADVAGDCDDGCASCHPGGTETCDTVDNDCDGTADEGDATDAITWYIDCDGDGYAADTSGARNACTEPAPDACGGGWVTTRPVGYSTTDCNDSNANVHPGQTLHFSSPIPGAAASVDYDYDCDGLEERQNTNTSVTSCTGTCGPVYQSGSGWTGSSIPACGSSASFHRCSYSIVTGTCNQYDTTETQRCR